MTGLGRGAQQRTAYAGAYRVAVALALGAVALLATVTVLGAWRERAEVFELAERRVANLTTVVQGHASRTFSEVDLVLDGLMIRQEVAPGDLQELLRRRTDTLPQLHSLVVLDPRGRVLASSLDTVPPGTDLAGEAMFAVHRAPLPPGGGFVGYPPARLIGRDDVFVRSIARRGADGALRGVALGFIERVFFEDFFRNVDPNATFRLLRTDDLLLAQNPPDGAVSGAPAPRLAGDWFRAREAAPEAGLVVEAALPVQPVLAAWQRELGEQILIFLAAAATTVALTLILFVQLRRVEESEKRFRSFAEASSDWMWETDDEHRFTWFSNLGSPMVPASLLGRTRLEAMSAASSDLLQRHQADLDARRPFRDVIYPTIQVEGRMRYVRASGSPQFDDKGRFTGYRGVGSDHTLVVDTAAALRATEADYRAIFENLPIGFYRSSPTGRQLRCNPALVRLNGYASEAEQVRAVNDIAKEWYVDPHRRAEFIALLERDGRVENFESEIFRHKTRERIWVTETAVLVRDRMGNPLYYEGTVEEITDRKRTELALSDLTRQLQNVFDMIDQAIAILDGDLKLVAWNDRVPQVLGVEPTLLQAGQPYERILLELAARGEYGPGDPEDLVRPYLDMLRTGQAVVYDRTRPDGTVVEVRGWSGRGSIVISYTDVTERRNFERRLIARNERMAVFIANMRDGVLVVDENMNIAIWNARLEEMLDLEPGLLQPNTPFHDVALHLARRGDYGPGNPEILAQQRTAAAMHVSTSTFERQTPSGRHLTGQSGRLPGGGFATVYTDVTERLRFEQALREAKEQAEAANRAKSEFLANMSHELRTPLNAILGFAEIIGDQMFGPKAVDRYAEYARDIRTSGQHLLGVIGDILDMSKIEAGRYELDDGPVRLGAVIETCLNMVRGRAVEGGVRIVADLGEGAPTVRGDQRALKQVVLNLLSNAVKFTPSGGVVEIAARLAPDGCAVVEVRDTGVGIPAEALGRIFEPFQQAEVGLARKYEGTGLGLSISRRFMALHDGSLDIASTPGQGTVVVARLPRERVMPGGR